MLAFYSWCPEAQSEKCQCINQLFMRIHYMTGKQPESFSHLGEGKLKRLINESSRWDRVVVNSTEGSVHKKINNLWHN